MENYYRYRTERIWNEIGKYFSHAFVQVKAKSGQIHKNKSFFSENEKL